jgi:hypothetical protein
MHIVSETVAHRRLLRHAAMVALVVPVAFLAACSQPQPAPQPAPMQAAPPPPMAPPPTPVPPARG